MIYIVAEHIASVLDAVILTVFLGLMLQWKKDRKKYTVIFILLQYICSQYFMYNPVLQIIMLIVINVVYCRVCLEGSLKLQLVWNIGTIIVFIVASNLMFLILSLITQQPPIVFIQANSLTRIFALVIYKMLQSIFIILVLLKKDRQLVLKKHEWWLILSILCVATVILVSFMLMNIELQMTGKPQKELAIIFFLIISLLVSSICMVVHISRLNRLLVDNQVLNVQLEAQKEMIIKAHEMQQEAKCIRHDMKYYVGVWLNQINAGNIQQVKEEMGGFIDKTLSSPDTISYIKDNELINSVIYSNMQNCVGNGIECSHEITSNFLHDRELDVAIMLSNLLENAVRAELDVEKDKRYIKIEIFKQNEKNHIVISNYIAESVLQKNPELRTTKKDKGEHGLGFLSTNNIVKKYNGYVNADEENSMFIVHVEGL